MNIKKFNPSQSAKNTYYMYGKHASLAALMNSKRKIEYIYCIQNIYYQYNKIINKYKYEIVDGNFLTKLVGLDHNHQGIILKLYSIFSDDINIINFEDPNCKIVILDQITDPQNIGAIIRSAAAFGIDSIILPNDNSPQESATIAKTACGTLELVKIIKVTNLKTTMDFLKTKGFWIIGLDSKADEILNKKLLTNKIAITLGSEDKGLRRLVKETCDHIVKISMNPMVESLNVANAASIVFHLAYLK